VGVLLLENALAAKAKGSPIEIAWPEDGAVVVPGYAAIMGSTQHAEAAKALVDALLSPTGQRLIAEGDMHAVDPRVAGPRGSISLDELVQKSAPWGAPVLKRGLEEGARVKGDFARAFAK
jgi:iron(III) transport system substrate-binding protein